MYNTVVNMKCERMRASTIPCRFWHISVVTVSGDHRSDYLLTYLLTHADGNGYGAFAGRGLGGDLHRGRRLERALTYSSTTAVDRRSDKTRQDHLRCFGAPDHLITSS